MFPTKLVFTNLLCIQHALKDRDKMSGHVENQPSAAYILSLIGGILGLIGSSIFIVVGGLVGLITFGLGFLVIGTIGLWIMVCSIIVIVAASKLNSEPLEHSKWGALILVFSIIGSWSILGLIGGILALVYTPRLVGAYPPQGAYFQQGYQQPITRVCPQCGRVLNGDLKFCPHCGKQLG